MNIYLQIVNGPMSGKKQILQASSQLTFGRTEKADFVIPDDRLISSLHFRLVCDRDSCRVQDLGSTNGTQVNSNPISDHLLSDGDRISAGETNFEFHVVGVASTPVLPADKYPSRTKSSAASAESNQIRPDDDELVSLFGSDKVENQESSDNTSLPIADTSQYSHFDFNQSSDRELPKSKSDFPEAVEIQLEIKSGKYAGRVISVNSNRSVVVGNADSANQSIDDDDLLSLNHFIVEFKQGGFQIRDLNSLRGTFVNGLQVAVAPLFDGDQIHAGNTEFFVNVVGDRSYDIEVTWPPFASALVDADPLVARQVLLAAAWTRQHWLLDFCRQSAAISNPRELAILHLLAILALPTDLAAMRDIARAVRLGPQRFQVLGSFGHPGIIDDVLLFIDDPDPATAVTAGQAFTRITGNNIDTEQRVEFAVEVKGASLVLEPSTTVSSFLPDSSRARALWDEVKDSCYQGNRWCCGQDLSNGITNENYLRLDTLALWEARLRGKFYGSMSDGLAAFEKFPMSKWQATVLM